MDYLASTVWWAVLLLVVMLSLLIIAEKDNKPMRPLVFSSILVIILVLVTVNQHREIKELRLKIMEIETLPIIKKQIKEEDERIQKLIENSMRTGKE